MVPLSSRASVFRGASTLFTPRKISGLQVWTESEGAGTNDGDAVAAWTDRSGNGTSATSSTGAQQPLYKTNIINGRPALLFDATDDRINIGAFTLGTVVVAAYYTAAAFKDYDGLWTGSSSEVYMIGSSGDVHLYSSVRATVTVRLNGVSYSFSGATQAVNGWRIFTARDSSPQSIAWVLGMDRSFGTRTWKGYIYGLAAYSSSLSDSDVTRVEQYFGSRVGVTIP